MQKTLPHRLEMPTQAFPDFVDNEIYFMNKELIPLFISNLAISITGAKPFNSGSEIENWLNQQDIETLKWVLYYTVYCFTH